VTWHIRAHPRHPRFFGISSISTIVAGPGISIREFETFDDPSAGDVDTVANGVVQDRLILNHDFFQEPRRETVAV
jgi:hypothetical protein